MANERDKKMIIDDKEYTFRDGEIYDGSWRVGHVDRDGDVMINGNYGGTLFSDGEIENTAFGFRAWHRGRIKE